LLPTSFLSKDRRETAVGKVTIGRAKVRKSSGRMASKGAFKTNDLQVGHRIRQRRTLLGMFQKSLGVAIAAVLAVIPSMPHFRGARCIMERPV
jgi:hypothetical protein